MVSIGMARKGFKGSYLTVYNNGDYGVYAFDSTDGIFDNVYAHQDTQIVEFTSDNAIPL